MIGAPCMSVSCCLVEVFAGYGSERSLAPFLVFQPSVYGDEARSVGLERGAVAETHTLAYAHEHSTSGLACHPSRRGLVACQSLNVLCQQGVGSIDPMSSNVRYSPYDHIPPTAAMHAIAAHRVASVLLFILLSLSVGLPQSSPCLQASGTCFLAVSPARMWMIYFQGVKVYLLRVTCKRFPGFLLLCW